MSFQRIFWLSFCLYFVNYSFTRVIVIDYNEEIKRVLVEMNITSPTPNDEMFARKVVDERIQKEKELELEKEKVRVKAELVKEKERADRAEWNLTLANNKIGGLENARDDALDRALKLFVMPYLCTRTELCLDVWSNATLSPGTSSTSYVRSNVPPGHELDSQTRANYPRNAKKIYVILQKSNDPRVIRFKNKINTLYPEFTDAQIADNFGLAVSLLHNCKHGAVGEDSKLFKIITSPGALVKALKRWPTFNNPVLLDILQSFQESIQ